MASPHCGEAGAPLNENLQCKISCKTCNYCASLHCALACASLNYRFDGLLVIMVWKLFITQVKTTQKINLALKGRFSRL